MTTEANIKITRNGSKVTSISVSMPIWTKLNDSGNLSIQIPFLGIETIAKNENDAEKAIEEAIISFCIISEKFGQGIERELQVLGWKAIAADSLEYDVNTDSVLEGIFKTGENYVNPHLELEAA